MCLAAALVTIAALAAAGCGSGESGGVPIGNLYYATEQNRHVQRRKLGRTLECPAEFVVHDRGSD